MGGMNYHIEVSFEDGVADSTPHHLPPHYETASSRVRSQRFSSTFEDQTMIDDFEGELKEIEYSGKSKADPVPLSTVSWNDDYKIAACKNGFAEGAYVAPSIYPLPIKFGHAVSLLKDWTMESPNPSERAPSNGWLFVNKSSASALIFKTIRNRSTPIYVTSAGSTPPPGQHTLVPNGLVLLFFVDAEARTSFNVDATNTSTYEYSYIEHPQVTVYFNAQGDWEMVSEEGCDAVANNAMSIIWQRRGHRSHATSEAGKAHL